MRLVGPAWRPYRDGHTEEKSFVSPSFGSWSLNPMEQKAPYIRVAGGAQRSGDCTQKLKFSPVTMLYPHITRAQQADLCVCVCVCGYRMGTVSYLESVELVIGLGFFFFSFLKLLKCFTKKNTQERSHLIYFAQTSMISW